MIDGRYFEGGSTTWLTGSSDQLTIIFDGCMTGSAPLTPYEFHHESPKWMSRNDIPTVKSIDLQIKPT